MHKYTYAKKFLLPLILLMASYLVMSQSIFGGLLPFAFFSKKPISCNGTVVGGHCWYKGTSTQNCTTVCSANGGFNSATITFAGSAGTLANCQLISDAFGDAVTVADTAGNAYGCHQAKKTNTYRSTNLTDASSGGNDIFRYCACNN